LLLNPGCVTQRQVEQIVAQSNAAMVVPVIDKAGEPPSVGWQETVAKLDQLVAAHSDQPVLVNHLQVRAAMVLTVNQQDSLAQRRWQEVDGQMLKTERDKALFDLHPVLLWWYHRAPIADPLSGQEINLAQAHRQRIDTQLESLQSPDIRIFLGTIRAQVALKSHNSQAVDTPQQRQAVAAALARDLKAYVDLFAQDDLQWVQANKTTPKTVEDLKLHALRDRIWLREMVIEFKNTAEALLASLDSQGDPIVDPQGRTVLDPVPPWEPIWVAIY